MALFDEQNPTFETDLLNRRPLAEKIERFINLESGCDYIPGGLVVSLNAEFGSGKTTFLKMWRHDIETRQDGGGQNKPIAVWLNAWESDYFADPLHAIISALSEAIEGANKTEKKKAVKSKGKALIKKAKNPFMYARKFAMHAAVQAINARLGVDLRAAHNAATEAPQQNETPPDVFFLEKERKKAMQVFKVAVADYANATESKIWIIVDELDRCRPDYAISYLETIKHIFDIKGLVFILAVNRVQLESSAKHAFGADLDFNEYYRRFVQTEVPLLAITKESYKTLTLNHLRRYLYGDKRRCITTGQQRPDIALEPVQDLMNMLQITPRQARDMFQSLAHLLTTSRENPHDVVPGYYCACAVMSMFRIGNRDFYDKIGTQKISPDHLKGFFSDLMKDYYEGRNLSRKVDFWVDFFRDGGAFKREDLSDQMIAERQTSSILERWGDFEWTDGNIFAKIHEKIESFSTQD